MPVRPELRSVMKTTFGGAGPLYRSQKINRPVPRNTPQLYLTPESASDIKSLTLSSVRDMDGVGW